MPFIQLPGDSTGKLVETVTPALSSAGSTMHREVMAIGDYTSTAIATVTSSGGLLITITNPSTAVTITNPSTAATVTQGTSPWLVHFTSGVLSTASLSQVFITGTSGGLAPVTTSGGVGVTILSGAGAGSTAVNIVGSSGAIAPATSSGGLSVTIVSGAGAGSTAVNFTVTSAAGFGPVSSSFGVLANISSGSYLIRSLSSGTVTLSSNPTVVNASSGQMGTFASTSRMYSIFTFLSSSGNSVTNITTAPAIFYGWNAGNQTTSGTASVKVYNSTGATVGSTTNLQNTIPLPGGSAGAGNNLMLPQGVSYPSGITFVLTANFAATSTGAVAANDVVGTLYYNT